MSGESIRHAGRILGRLLRAMVHKPEPARVLYADPAEVKRRRQEQERRKREQRND